MDEAVSRAEMLRQWQAERDKQKSSQDSKQRRMSKPAQEKRKRPASKNIEPVQKTAATTEIRTGRKRGVDQIANTDDQTVQQDKGKRRRLDQQVTQLTTANRKLVGDVGVWKRKYSELAGKLRSSEEKLAELSARPVAAPPPPHFHIGCQTSFQARIVAKGVQADLSPETASQAVQVCAIVDSVATQAGSLADETAEQILKVPPVCQALADTVAAQAETDKQTSQVALLKARIGDLEDALRECLSDNDELEKRVQVDEERENKLKEAQSTCTELSVLYRQCLAEIKFLEGSKAQVPVAMSDSLESVGIQTDGSMQKVVDCLLEEKRKLMFGQEVLVRQMEEERVVSARAVDVSRRQANELKLRLESESAGMQADVQKQISLMQRQMVMGLTAAKEKIIKLEAELARKK